MSLPSPKTYEAVLYMVKLLQTSSHVRHYVLGALACVEDLARLRGESELSNAVALLRLEILRDPALDEPS